MIITIKQMFEIEFDRKQIESTLPDYKYVKKLGSGAYAVVHLVQQRATQQQLALKKVNCFGLSEYEKAGAMNEVRILSSLEHKNIIKVSSCILDNTEDVIYIFMEHAESGDLALLIEQAKEKKKRIPQSTIWKVIADVSEGLRYLHQNQIVHRDIKPANIFRAGRNFKIGDMNVSKIIKNGVAASTKTGSPLYSAPEVWNAEGYSFECDVWSLGALVYELVTLRVPYEAESIIQLMKKIKQQKLKSIPSIYSPTLDELIKKMLEVNPSKRIMAQDVLKIANLKMKVETQGLDDEGVESLMETIVFPDTHQRWVNIIPAPLPPKTSRKQILKAQNMQENKWSSKQKIQESELLLQSGCGFKSTERRQGQPSSKSRGKPENKNDIKMPNLPPIYRSNSPVIPRKRAQQKKEQVSSQKRERSLSRSRKSAIDIVMETKQILKSEKKSMRCPENSPNLLAV